MTGIEPNDRSRERVALACAACETPYAAGDRFCAQCGAPLPESAPRETPLDRLDGALPPPANETSALAPAASIAATSAPPAREESSLWLLSARPRVVIVGGLLLLLLAVILLAVGQLDWTGTLVMLAICAAALGLFTIGIGILRLIWNAVAGR
ncbi:MAG: hypothetical protein IT338_06430 [Thermomicrobiales bacterium]|nr:hypothetical protein [Thermomicrobiales bacterium]